MGALSALNIIMVSDHWSLALASLVFLDILKYSWIFLDILWQWQRELYQHSISSWLLALAKPKAVHSKLQSVRPHQTNGLLNKIMIMKFYLSGEQLSLRKRKRSANKNCLVMMKIVLVVNSKCQSGSISVHYKSNKAKRLTLKRPSCN